MNTNIPIPSGKVLVQLSGGKDSVACLCFLKDHNVPLEAIHFVHDYGYPLPSKMAKLVCEALGVKLHIVDITAKIKSLFLANFNQRPCRFCKSIMDSETVALAISLECNYICVGDTKDDTMLLNRIKNKNGLKPYFSRYFNQAVELPNNISVFRPFLEIGGSTALSYVKSRFPFFQRVNDTGDKYFEYSREGCPLQFKDLGVNYSESLMDNLLKYNSLCSEFATKRGIKASIHLPSEFIVTIPKGFEQECRDYLISHGCKLSADKNVKCDIVYNIIVKLHTKFTLTIFDISIRRFVERCGFKISSIIQSENSISVSCEDIDVIATYQHDIMNIVFISKKEISNIDINNIVMEIFHTYSFSITINRV